MAVRPKGNVQDEILSRVKQQHDAHRPILLVNALKSEGYSERAIRSAMWSLIDMGQLRFSKERTLVLPTPKRELSTEDHIR